MPSQTYRPPAPTRERTASTLEWQNTRAGEPTSIEFRSHQSKKSSRHLVSHGGPLQVRTKTTNCASRLIRGFRRAAPWYVTLHQCHALYPTQRICAQAVWMEKPSQKDRTSISVKTAAPRPNGLPRRFKNQTTRSTHPWTYAQRVSSRSGTKCISALLPTRNPKAARTALFAHPVPPFGYLAL